MGQDLGGLRGVGARGRLWRLRMLGRLSPILSLSFFFFCEYNRGHFYYISELETLSFIFQTSPLGLAVSLVPPSLLSPRRFCYSLELYGLEGFDFTFCLFRSFEVFRLDYVGDSFFIGGEGGRAY